MQVIVLVLAIVGALALLSSIWYAVRWLYTKTGKKRRLRKRFIVSIIFFAIAVVCTGLFATYEVQVKAITAGFDSGRDYLAAKRENVLDPKQWEIIVAQRDAEAKAIAAAAAARAQIEAIKARELAVQEAALAIAEAKRAIANTAKAEAEQQAKIAADVITEQGLLDVDKANMYTKKLDPEAECRTKISCWGERAIKAAVFSCPRYVGHMAPSNYEWTDAYVGLKFSTYRWSDEANGIVTASGDQIKFQNDHGGWSNMVYECDIDPATNEVLDVRVYEGRL